MGLTKVGGTLTGEELVFGEADFGPSFKIDVNMVQKKKGVGYLADTEGLVEELLNGHIAGLSVGVELVKGNSIEWHMGTLSHCRHSQKTLCPLVTSARYIYNLLARVVVFFPTQESRACGS